MIQETKRCSLKDCLPAARERLVTIVDEAPLVEAAKLLRTGTGLVVVCGSAGLLAGVITRTDIVRPNQSLSGSELHHCQPSLVMTRDVVAGPRKATRGLVENEGARVEERSYYG